MKPWAEIRVTLADLGKAHADGLEELAGLIATRAAVTGIELRDASTFDDMTPEPSAGGHEIVVFTVPEALDQLGREIGELAVSFGATIADVRTQTRLDDDWHDRWKAFYTPIVIGSGRLLLRPSWIERRPGDPELELVIDPGRAFGTGQHETTRLCLEALCEAQPSPGPRVLDLGAGSGILSLAAVRLFGPGTEVVAVDVDPEAVATTDENAVRNGLDASISTVMGTLADVAPSDRFDVVVANIRADVLVPLAAALARRLRPAGVLVLSGILDSELGPVRHAYAQVGLTARSERAQGEWCALVLGSRPT